MEYLRFKVQIDKLLPTQRNSIKELVKSSPSTYIKDRNSVSFFGKYLRPIAKILAGPYSAFIQPVAYLDDIVVNEESYCLDMHYQYDSEELHHHCQIPIYWALAELSIQNEIYEFDFEEEIVWVAEWDEPSSIDDCIESNSILFLSELSTQTKNKLMQRYLIFRSQVPMIENSASKKAA